MGEWLCWWQRNRSSCLSCPGLSRVSTPLPRGKAWMAGTSPAMTVDRYEDEHSFRRLRDHRIPRQIHHRQLRADPLRRPVLETNHRVDRDFAGAAIDVVDNGS